MGARFGAPAVLARLEAGAVATSVSVASAPDTSASTLHPLPRPRTPCTRPTYPHGRQLAMPRSHPRRLRLAARIELVVDGTLELVAEEAQAADAREPHAARLFRGDEGPDLALDERVDRDDEVVGERDVDLDQRSSGLGQRRASLEVRLHLHRSSLPGKPMI